MILYLQYDCIEKYNLYQCIQSGGGEERLRVKTLTFLGMVGIF